MKSRNVLTYLIVITIMLAFMPGCSKKEDSSTVEDETAPESNVQATEPESPEQSVSPLVGQFLKKSAGSYKKVIAGIDINDFFGNWENRLQHHPRTPMEIYFDVELEEKFQRDHIWENKTNQEVLDDLCNEYNLAWTTPEPNTIRISKKPD
jgi:hypothetical protein